MAFPTPSTGPSRGNRPTHQSKHATSDPHSNQPWRGRDVSTTPPQGTPVVPQPQPPSHTLAVPPAITTSKSNPNKAQLELNSTLLRSEEVVPTEFSSLKILPPPSFKDVSRYNLNPSLTLDTSNEQKAINCLKRWTHDEIKYAVGWYAKQKQFWPLSLLASVIKKFDNSNFGTLVEAEEFYQIIQDKYPKDMANMTNKYVRSIHAEMMRVYIHKTGANFERLEQLRKALTDDPNNDELLGDLHQAEAQMAELLAQRKLLEKMYDKHKDTWTFNALLEYHNACGQYDITIDKFEKWEDEELTEEDSWKWKYYLEAVLKRKGEAAFRQICESIKDKTEIITDSYFAVLYMRHYIGADNLQGLLDHFDKIKKPTDRSDQVCRVILRSYFYQKVSTIDMAYRYTDDALRFFRSWPAGSKSDSTYACILNHLSVCMQRGCLKECLDILQEAHTNNDSMFSKAIYFDEKKSQLKINLHQYAQMGGGGSGYGPLPFNVACVILWFVHYRYLNKLSPRSRLVTIQIITGKGKAFEMRTSIAEFVREHFGWDTKLWNDKEDAGALHLRETVENLTKPYKHNNLPDFLEQPLVPSRQ